MPSLRDNRKPGFSQVLKVVMNCQKNNVLFDKLEPCNGRNALRPCGFRNIWLMG